MGCGPSSESYSRDGELTYANETVPAPSTGAHRTSTCDENVRGTATSASLVSSDSRSTAFHGLLLGSSRPPLQYEQTFTEDENPGAAVHPNDDSFSAPLSYDAKYGVLTLSDVVMSLRYTVIISDNPEHEGRVRKIVHGVLDIIHSTCNGWFEGSEISKLNQLKPEKEARLSKTLATLFDVVDELHDITEGRFDPTCGVVKLAFSETLAVAGRPPVPAELNKFRFATGWKKRLQRNGNIVKKSNANTVIDLDGVSKGHCVDLIVDALSHAGYTNFYVDWAGDIRAVGTHPSGRPWRTVVMNPPDLPRLFKHWKNNTLGDMLKDADVGYFVDLDLENEKPDISICTSGDYFQIKKFGYHHIVTTNSVMKATQHSTGTVSVLAATCAIADGVATAAMTFDSPESTVAFLKRAIEKAPEKIYGFCVIGRDNSDNTMMRTTQHFLPNLAKPEKSIENDVRVTPAPSIKPVEGPLWQCPGQLSWSGGFVDVDSVTPCSMNPTPKVSFLVPRTLTTSSSLFCPHPSVRSQVFERVQFSYVFGETTSSAYFGQSSIRFLLEICDVFAFENVAVVIASIVEVQHGPSDSVLAVCGDRSVRIQLPNSLIRDDSLHRTVIVQAKERFGEIPFSVCVITCTAADGTTVGFTATSLVLPEHCPNTFCFNVQHSSTFYAAFGGEGALVVVYPLSAGSQHLAKNFSERAVVEAEMKQELERASTCVMEGIATRIMAVEDHAVVLSEIKDLRKPNDPPSGLVWYHRKYTTLE